MVPSQKLKGRSGKCVEAWLIVQGDALGSSEFCCNVIKGASLGLREASPGEGECKQSHKHEETVTEGRRLDI